MDFTSILAEGGKLGFVVILLLVAVRYLLKKDEASDALNAKLIAEHKAEAISREEKNRAECIKREEDLSSRLRHIEDRQSAEQTALLIGTAKALQDNAAAMRDNAAAFRAIAESPSGLHRIVTGRVNPG